MDYLPERPLLRVESFPAADDELQSGRPGALLTVAAAEPSVLLDILHPGIGLAICPRCVEDGLDADLARLAAGEPFDATGSGDPTDALSMLAQNVPAPLPAWLRHDLQWLADLLAVVSASRTVSTSLSLWPGQPPRPAPSGLRLVCRYHGAPMLWSVPHGGRCHAGGCLDTHAIAILKGATRPSLRSRAIRLGETGSTNAPVSLTYTVDVGPL